MNWAAEVAQRTGAPVAIHADDADDLAVGRTRLGVIRDWEGLSNALLPVVEPLLRVKPVSNAYILHDGFELDELGLGSGTVLHTPGHTPGSSTLLIHGQAFVGDMASTTVDAHAQESYAHDWNQLQASLERVQALDPEHIYPGHGERPLNAAEFQSLYVPYATNR